MKLEFLPVKTRLVRSPKDEIWDILDGLDVREGDIIFISSKVLAIAEGRCVSAEGRSKEELAREEAERFLHHTLPAGYSANLTITQGVLIPAAGIDASNADGYYEKWPKDPDEMCRRVRERLRKQSGVSRLGVVATDSHSTPLRYGVTGMAIGLAGVEPLEDIRGKTDLYGRELKITQVNKIDPLAAMAVAVMGEADEMTPIVILRGYTDITFSETGSMRELKVPLEDDLYRPLLEVLPETR